MRILLLGEYSNLHWTLAEGLRELGHKVVVASDGDGFKNYLRDIDLLRKSSSIKDTIVVIYKIIKNLKHFKGYDVVQLINPCFTTLNVKINAILYRYIKKHNKKVFLGAFGDDSFWLRTCLDRSTFRYSEFFVDGVENILKDIDQLKKKWINSEREKLNIEIADSCDGIIACLYEYYVSYKKEYKYKLRYIALPINLEQINKVSCSASDKIIFFIGINKVRSEFKGTDRLYNSLQKLQKEYPHLIDINMVESVSYQEYVELMSRSHVVLDQLYSYSPSMNALQAMAMGKVLVGGGEPEMYDLLSETNNRPIINVYPSDEDIYLKLETLLLNRERIAEIAEKGRLFVEKHHNHIQVAKQYLDFWMNSVSAK